LFDDAPVLREGQSGCRDRVGPRAQGTSRPATWVPQLKKPYEGDNRDEVTDPGSFGSAPLSHLFQQALVAGETFKTVAQFRSLANEKLPLAYRLRDPAQSPEGFQVALGIVQAGDELHLPFFSKVTLGNAFRLLTGFGFSVALAHIRVGDGRARMAVARPRPGRR
jgi:Family of unknown function (DUF6119)